MRLGYTVAALSVLMNMSLASTQKLIQRRLGGHCCCTRTRQLEGHYRGRIPSIWNRLESECLKNSTPNWLACRKRLQKEKIMYDSHYFSHSLLHTAFSPEMFLLYIIHLVCTTYKKEKGMFVRDISCVGHLIRNFQ